MAYKQYLQEWLDSPVVDEATKEELRAMTDEQAQSAFFTTLEFGTAGIRGVMGAGLTRMNVYIVRQTTEGMARYLLKQGAELADAGVVIGYDCRNNSKLYAEEAAAVLAANNIKVYLYESLRPTPCVSFAIRHLKTTAGIVITASHNPAQYNGYKAYWSDGGQLPPHVSDRLTAEIADTPIFAAKTMPIDEAISSGRVTIIGANVDEAYYSAVLAQLINKDLIAKHAADFKLVYTPFHGAGNVPVREALKRAGFPNITVVPEQEQPDGNFPTVKSPNPEDKEGFALAIELAKKVNVDLIIGTDPDSDRVGIVVRNNSGEYVSMTGNQVGVLLAHYILSMRKATGTMPPNPAIISTIVSTKMTDKVVNSFGATYIETLTGFKFMGEKILEFEETGSNNFLYGFEESYGYLAGSYARDKDAVVASMLIAEMALYYSTKSMTLFDAMEQLYTQYGRFLERTINIKMEGDDGMARMQAAMTRLRNNPPAKVAGLTVTAIRDYKTGTKRNLISGEETALTLPKSDVLYYELENNINFVIRPSGTEPKIKIYLLIQASTVAEATAIANALGSKAEVLINNLEFDNRKSDSRTGYAPAASYHNFNNDHV